MPANREPNTADRAEIIPRTTLTAILGARNLALATMGNAIAQMQQAHQRATEAASYAEQAHGLDRFYQVDRTSQEQYRRLFIGIDPEGSAECYRRHVDACTWMRIIRETGMESLMDQTARDELHAALATMVPELTEDNVCATIEGLVGDAPTIFRRGLARVFSDLDRRFKSHDGFKIGSRIVLTHMFSEWGGFNDRTSATLIDIERVFAVLDGNRGGSFLSLVSALRDSRGGGFTPRQSKTETTYFRANGFMNGNLHLWFTRDDLVERANLELAAYYGEVLPDAMPGHAETLRNKATTTTLSRDLAFYPTPDPVVAAMLSHVRLDGDSFVLEPSAGTGAIVRRVLATGAKVSAVEVDAGRSAELERIPSSRLTVTRGNFLDIAPHPLYSHVLMNPPFYGKHWMSHVMHAYDFLVPGGTLVSVLPVTAELGDSAEHVAFREWAQERGSRSRWEACFRDLPSASFASSGTRINTVLLILRKRT